MNAPIATYRIQLSKEFDFHDLKEILPYLSKLGISHIYASPITQAKQGSKHGYDVVDHNKISEELGGETGLKTLVRKMKDLGLGWLQDIVPNHSSYSLENRAVRDLWERGIKSKFSSTLDVDWCNPHRKLNGKILLPLLKQPYAKCLREGQLSLIYNDGFKIRYNDLELPINNETQKQLSYNGCLEEIIIKINHDPYQLNELLSKQFYILSYWKTALKHINYRRFFDILDLIGLRMEDPKTFEDTHRLIFKLAKEDCLFSGIRVDHIDGLYQPDEYLNKLRRELPEVYLIVEKILADFEKLPKNWPIQGTTGYDFLNFSNKLFIQNRNEGKIDSLYKEFSGNEESFSQLLYEAKKHVIETYFLGDIRNIAYLFHCTIRALKFSKQYTYAKLPSAIIELFACFPVYRTYLGNLGDKAEFLQSALIVAEQRKPELTREFSAITYLIQQSQTDPKALHALKRLQQFTGAVMAKGFEDTALYRYVRLISLNDVGSNPAQFGISMDEFHQFNLLRQHCWPLTLNATSTHDTKRGEDIRARLNVLSEIPDDFRESMKKWRRTNENKKRRINGLPTPDANEEYYIYQTLIGAYPWNTDGEHEFKERIRLHIIKALREAKVHTNWLSPDLDYENAVTDFVMELLLNDDFTESFLTFQRKIAFFGLFNSLSQTLLKITSPGIPDFYQGTELWDLNLVDPDNRRSVNFQKRRELLSEVMNVDKMNASDFLSDCSDGKTKLYVIYKALMFRQKWRLLFEEGSYIPLAVKGKYAEHIIAFARKESETYVVIIVPRLLASLLWHNEGLFNEKDIAEEAATFCQKSKLIWNDMSISLPIGAPRKWTDVFTNLSIFSSSARLSIRDVLGSFPVALLLGDNTV